MSQHISDHVQNDILSRVVRIEKMLEYIVKKHAPEFLEEEKKRQGSGLESDFRKMFDSFADNFTGKKQRYDK